MSIDDRASGSNTSTYDAFISYSHAADGLLAPRLQSALQRFAKPWWQRRAIRVFRDEASLAANPHLWSSITDALDQSEWFVLLLSPNAADSEWVNNEVAYWLANKPANRILPVVTEGEFTWNSHGPITPPALAGAFKEEPRWVDLRFAHTEDTLDLNNARFRNAIADIASAVRSIPKEDLESEEVRQHRRTKRTAWAAGVTLLALAVAAVGFAVNAATERDRANQLAVDEAEAAAAAEVAKSNALDASEVAATERDRANLERDRANELAVQEEAARQQADTNAALATSRELAASAINVLESDPELSILLSLTALDSIPAGETVPIESMVALREAIHTSNLIGRFVVPGGESPVSGALSADGTRFAWLSDDSVTVRVFDTGTWEELWVHQQESADQPEEVFFSNDGSRVLFSLLDADPDDSAGARIVVLDAEAGALSRVVELGACPDFTLGPQPADGSVWPVVVNPGPDCVVDGEGWQLTFLDPETFQPRRSFRTTGRADSIEWPLNPEPDTNRVAAVPGHVFDYDTGEQLSFLPDGWSAVAIGPDGIDAAGSPIGESTVFIWRADERPAEGFFDKLIGLPVGEIALDLEFYGEGGGKVIAGSRGGGAIAWDVESGEVDHIVTTAGPVTVIEFDHETGILYYIDETEISTWDLSGRSQGELNTEIWPGFAQGNSLDGRANRGAFLSFEDRGFVLRAFVPGSGLSSEAALSVDQWARPAVLPDGSVVGLPLVDINDEVHQTGPVVAWDPSNGSTRTIAGCVTTKDETIFDRPPSIEPSYYQCDDDEGEFVAADSFFVDPAGETLMVADVFNRLTIYDASTLEQVASYDLGRRGGSIREYEGTWVLQGDLKLSHFDIFGPGAPGAPATSFEVVDLGSGEVLAAMPGSVADLSDDGTLLAVHDRPGQATIYDTVTWEALQSVGAGDARIRGLAFSPNGSKLMTGATDGFVRIWDVRTGAELHRIPVGSVSDGYWADESHVTVAAGDGLFTTLTIDRAELIDLALGRLSRSFDPDECQLYRIDPCPSLEELLSG